MEEYAKMIELFKFVEWTYTDGNWYFKDGLWGREGYRSRTTQELFEYYLKDKRRQRSATAVT